MNAYEQLVAIRERLELNGANEASIDLVDKFLAKAVAERENAMNVPRVLLVKSLLRTREALGNDAIYNDLQELMEEEKPSSARRSDDDAPYAYEEEHRPRPHSYYKQQKARERDTQK